MTPLFSMRSKLRDIGGPALAEAAKRLGRETIRGLSLQRVHRLYGAAPASELKEHHFLFQGHWTDVSAHAEGVLDGLRRVESSWGPAQQNRRTDQLYSLFVREQFTNDWVEISTIAKLFEWENSIRVAEYSAFPLEGE